MKLLREPLVHFLLIGMAIYGLYGLFGQHDAKTPISTITITAGEIDWLATSWQKRWNRPPTPAERDGLIRQYVRETILYREALAMGLDKDDTIIRRRLAQKLEFLAQDLVALNPPTEEDLRAYFADHRERYEEPVRYTFTQVFIDPDRRGDATLHDAKKIKAKLMAQPDAIDDAGALGDAFMLQNYYPENSQADIQKQFGSGFAESVADLPPGEWHGPVLSGYGVHLVYVHSRSEPPASVFAEVRDRVAQDWEDDKRQELNEQYYASLRARYDVVIEDKVSDGVLAARQEQPQ
jgi:hypothetical protein